MQEEKEYLLALTDEIRVVFNYNRAYSKATSMEAKYYIKSKLSIFNRDNDREIFKEEKELTDVKEYKDKKEINIIQDLATIKLEDYKELVDRYVLDYSVNSRAQLELQLIVKEDDKETSVASISLPLLEKTYSITKFLVENEPEEQVSTNFKNYLFVSLLLIVLDIIFIGVWIFRLMKSKGVSEFEQEVQRILIDYDRIIVETKSTNISYEGKEITELDSFMELIDVRDTIEKPILYVEVNADERDFIVQDQNIIYRYKMTTSNFKDQ